MDWTDGVDYVGLVEGGADTTIPIDASIARVRSPQAGAVSTFLGTTRDSFEGQEVTALSYEAYTDMAVGSMRELCGKVRQQWSVTKIAVLHKLGDCPIGEVSVLIAVSSPHRKEALEAVQYAIDELKRTVPIWKKVRTVRRRSLGGFA